MVIVKSVAGKAAPYWACAACGEAITRRGSYGWRWAAVGTDEIAAVSTWHPKCRPDSDAWEFGDLEKLPGFLAHNFESWKLARPPRAGHKGLPREIRKRQAAMAAVIQAHESEAQAETSPPVPPSAARAPEPAPRVVPPPEPEPEKPTGIVQPCISVTVNGPTPWDAETVKHCGQPSVPGKPWCFAHWADLFQNPALERLMHGRR